MSRHRSRPQPGTPRWRRCSAAGRGASPWAPSSPGRSRTLRARARAAHRVRGGDARRGRPPASPVSPRRMAVPRRDRRRRPAATSSRPSPGGPIQARSPTTARSCSGPTTTACSCSRSATSRPRATSRAQTAEEHAAAAAGAVQLQSGRLEIPRGPAQPVRLQHWLVNIAGSTLFMPIADVTRQCISALLLYFDRPHGYYLRDPHARRRPLRPFVDDGCSPTATRSTSGTSSAGRWSTPTASRQGSSSQT